ncbi:hypothetical protein AVEN_2219-1 [Araneus ventricosus]|uniref:Uncharacterized protein n=1 Tax=Araneus ventricosus TaxID=182803 RepID=A0A4Y2T2Q4_ARAVE|nr:hypothetical protein AVEN_2219-1 [Araneus ventricosus]
MERIMSRRFGGKCMIVEDNATGPGHGAACCLEGMANSAEATSFFLRFRSPVPCLYPLRAVTPDLTFSFPGTGHMNPTLASLYSPRAVAESGVAKHR